MDSHGGRPDQVGQDHQSRREAVTVEIGYALVSAAFAAVVVFGAVAGPALLFDLPGTVETVLVHAGTAIAPVLFAARVISVLLRFRHTPARGQPSQPGRTNPDS